MDESQSTPKIFDRELYAARKERATRRNESFIIKRVLGDAAERLLDVARSFESVLFIGSAPEMTALQKRLPDGKWPGSVERATISGANDALTAPGDDRFDLIISLLELHAVNDLPGVLAQIRSRLKPDGLFLGALFGETTLSELRQACYAADETVLGGITARVFPFASYRELGALLQRTGFALPVVDRDRIRVTYKSLDTLISDLRDMGETNCLTARSERFLPRHYKTELERVCQGDFADEKGRLMAGFEICWLSAWAPHASQQKPLRPGSGQIHLSDVFKKP